MPSERTTYRKLISSKLKDRKIVWVGSQGCDAIPLTEFKHPVVSICLGHPAKHEDITEHTYERLMNTRVNPYIYDAEKDNSEGIKELQRILIQELSEPCCLIPHKPMRIVDTAYFLNHRTTELLGHFSDFQRPFTHKTWIETALEDDGIRIIPWNYVQVNEAAKQKIFRAALETPLMLRIDASCAGYGIMRIDNKENFDAAWSWLLKHNTPLVAYSPYFTGASPISGAASVFPDGRVALHPISLKCIGNPDSPAANHGYSGNDFGAAQDLPDAVINQFEGMLRHVGKWLAAKGFLGIFGIDALLHEENLLFNGITPNFLASSGLSSQVDEMLGRPNMYMTHMASFLGLPPPPQIPLRELNSIQPQLGQMIFHNTQPHLVTVETNKETYTDLPFSVSQTPKPDVSVTPGSPISTLRWSEKILEPDGMLNETGKFIASTFRETITIRPHGLNLKPPSRPK